MSEGQKRLEEEKKDIVVVESKRLEGVKKDIEMKLSEGQKKLEEVKKEIEAKFDEQKKLKKNETAIEVAIRVSNDLEDETKTCATKLSTTQSAI